MKWYIHIGIFVVKACIDPYVHVVGELPGAFQWDF